MSTKDMTMEATRLDLANEDDLKPSSAGNSYEWPRQLKEMKTTKWFGSLSKWGDLPFSLNVFSYTKCIFNKNPNLIHKESL